MISHSVDDFADLTKLSERKKTAEHLVHPPDKVALKINQSGFSIVSDKILEIEDFWNSFQKVVLNSKT